jgi:beta-N-acetylhexosaminidase/D-alanyl-D-alanine dipeptidase
MLIFFALLALIQPRAHSSDIELVNVLELDPDFVLDIRYATDNNFTGKVIYTPEQARCLLRRPVAEALVAAHAEAKKLGYRFKLFDCFRPIAAQVELWKAYPNPDYVAEPRFDPAGLPIKGSKHNRGAAVDLTLVTLDGGEVPMPTEYDDFSERAHPGHPSVPKAIQANVRLLSALLQAQRFTPIATEWWHYDGPDWQRYPLE